MTDEEVCAFAIKHGLTDDQSRRMCQEHGSDESRWGEAARTLLQFLKAAS